MTTAGLLVFVVDDDPSVRRALSRLLRSLGFDAETFATAEDLLACDHLDAGACVLLDVQMRGMSGPALQQRLSALGYRTPVVLISGQEDARARMAAKTAGASAFLQKPFAEQALLDAVHEALYGDCSANGGPAGNPP